MAGGVASMSIKDRSHLIDTLTLDLQPVKVINVGLMTLYFLVGAFVFSLSLFLLTGPFRSGAGHQLLSSPQFLVESCVGVLSIALLMYAAFQLAIPSPKPLLSQLKWPLIGLIVWISFYAFGFVRPALEPSALGMRDHCNYQVFIFGIPTLLVALYWLNKQWPIYPVSTGFLMGLAAGAIPALIMQFACMYDPHHILTAHIGPGILVGVLGACIGAISLTRHKKTAST
ncbi:MAG: hypothetical protein COA95_04950 [Methylophaga sp.]|nr:MAG: hypothetical protein COA95_04950 [Methylophaga sp.]